MQCTFPNCSLNAVTGSFCIGHAKFAGAVTIKPAKPLQPRSEKQKAVMAELKKLYKVFMSNPKNKQCRAKLEGCTLEATDIHHSRGRGKEFVLDIKTFVPLCRSCHTHLESHPELSEKLGFTKSRLKKA